MNTVMVIMIFLKINTWMRLNDEFSNLYTLVIQCVKDITLFMLYFLYWVIFFASIYIILGADFNVGEKAADYMTLKPLETNFIGVFRNSLGDIAIPGIEYWLIRKEMEEDKLWASFFIHFIWLIILFNTVLTLIVLLNFLIAIVSESYNRMNSM